MESNIRGFRDMEIQGQGEMARQAVRINFDDVFSSRWTQSMRHKEPRQESFWDMVKFSFCPLFSPRACTFIFFVVSAIAFFA